MPYNDTWKEACKIGTTQTKASIKYRRKTYRVFQLKLRYDSDKDLIEFLESKESINSYLKKLITDDKNK